MTDWNVQYVSKEQLFENTKKIFNTVQANISTSITEYLDTHIYVFFKDNKCFAYMPFEQLDYTNYFYNMFITDDIDFIIIAYDDTKVIYTSNMHLPNILGTYIVDYVEDFVINNNYYFLNIHLPDIEET